MSYIIILDNFVIQNRIYYYKVRGKWREIYLNFEGVIKKKKEFPIKL